MSNFIAVALAVLICFFALVDASDDAAAKRKRDEERKRR